MHQIFKEWIVPWLMQLFSPYVPVGEDVCEAEEAW